MGENFPSFRLTPFTGPLLAIFVFSLVLRFWNLGQFNELVFDEVYYAKFASDYWLGKPFFPSHPPLSHYLIALAMGLGNLFPVNPDQVNDLTGVVRSTWSYRWLNALTGASIPLLMGAIAYLLTQRQRLTVLVMGLTALDGLLLVESRYALNNIYLIFFGLLGHIFVLWYLQQRQRWQLILAGIALGCAGSVKWNGFAFLLGIYTLWALAWSVHHWHRWRSPQDEYHDHRESYALTCREEGWQQPWLALTPQQVLLWLVLLPLLTYSLIWIPHLLMNPDYASLQGFWQIQVDTWQYHRRVGNSPDVHPYCSPWYSWLIMGRPVAYFFQKSGPFGLIYDVHSMANPALLWLSTGAMGLLASSVAWARLRHFSPTSPLPNTSVYIAVNYGVNLLPWLGISRCTFFYHYLPAYLFSLLALALILETLLQPGKSWHRVVGLTCLGVIMVSFWFWLPIFLGMPLTPQGFSLRMWFRSWI
ncbi:MAG: phospholipid carrier-dependent glycosyltransferase [Synechocystis sp.]|nr:phospholipid carrier-dependent glycosyltransferase [Synechocystis sp.]